MHESFQAVLVGLAGILFGLGLLAVAVLWLRSIKVRTSNRLESALGGADRVLLKDDSANCIGVRAPGLIHVTGNGCLILSRSEAVFRPWNVPKEVRIEISRLTRVETGHTFLKKVTPFQQLQVSWTTPSGREGRAAWIIRDLEAWAEKLEELRTGKKVRGRRS